MHTDQEFQQVVSLPQFPGASVVTRRQGSEDPDEATAETVALMTAAAIEDSRTAPVMDATAKALGRGAHSQRSACASIYRWLAKNIRFRSDEGVLAHLLGLDEELDLLIRPARLLTMQCPAEDCDGFTMLACSMMLCAGIPCEIVTIKADHEDPSRFSHVYCQALLDDGVLVMDCSQAAQHGFPIGWEPPEYYDRKTWGVMEPDERPRKKGLHGLGLADMFDDSASYWDDFFGGSGGGSGYGGSSIGGMLASSSPGGGSSFNPSALFASIAQTGGRLIQQANLPPGYALLPNGTVAPAGVLTAGGMSISPNMLLIGGGLLLALVVLGGRK